MKSDGRMFIGVLGDIDEGMLHFESMIKDYGIVPSMDHYVKVRSEERRVGKECA